MPANADSDRGPASPAGLATGPDNSSPASPDAGGSVFGLVRALVGELPGLLSDRVQLFSLELRRSGLALARMVAWAVAAAVLLTTAWLALWVGVGAGAIRAGWPWYAVLAGILLINVAAAGWAVARARALAPQLALPATLRRLTLSPSPQPTGEAPTRPVTAVAPGQPLQAERSAADPRAVTPLDGGAGRAERPERPTVHAVTETTAHDRTLH